MKRISLALFLFAALMSQMAYGIGLENLFSPGDVIKGHAKLQDDCKNCHVRGRKMSRNQLCMDCHKKVAADVKQHKGFHGRNKKVTSAQCRTCHTEHKGRDAQIVWLDKDRFNHDLTDYRLLGKHRQVLCKSCHVQSKKFRQAPGKCIDCHKKDDIHKGKLGKQCSNCHNPKAWSSEQFDHDKTKFKLRFAHKKVACDLCHVENRYKHTPKKCVSCHAIKDVHKNRFGNDCKRCHTQKKWSETWFRHDRDTRFRLKGKHKTVTCNACHSASKQAVGKTRRPRQCNDCHRLDDVHKGDNGKQCDKCHAETSWRKNSFDHNKDTKFKLHGAHIKASCESCHQKDIRGKKTSPACYSCHEHQDAHKGQEGKDCGKCHNDSTWWLEDVRYDHDLTDFPLLGQHAVVGCEACHLSSAFKDVKKQCIDCHREDDIHKQTLGENCQQCHNPNDWLIWQFDHDQTDFRIEGAHEKLHCSLCHVKPMKKGQKLKHQCIDCHRADDVHDGNFGADCDRCHTQTDFSVVNIQ